MKTRLFLAIAAAALIAASCSNDENDATIDNWNGEIRLSSGVTVQQTRTNSAGVPDTQIAGGQEVGVFISDAIITTSVISTNLKYDADGNGALTLGGGQDQPYYPQSGNNVEISAYHPYNAGTDDEYDFTVEGNQSLNANYYKSDLLYSKTDNFARSKTAHSLTFAHKLCKISCTLKAGSGISSVDNATVEVVNAEKAVKFNRTTGTVGTASASSKSNVTLGTYGAIIAPQTVVQNTKLLKIMLAGGGEFYHTTTSETTFAGGSHYTYTITVNATGLTVTSTITAWTSVGPTSGTAEMD